jgi:perosamine synthetase
MINVERVNALLTGLLVPDGETIPLHAPEFSGNEWLYVKECLDTGWVSSVGKFVDRFESDLQDFTGARHAIATVNGTAALHICFLLAGVQPDDEVLVPTLTFVATVNALAYCGAIPHFIDSDETTLGLDVPLLDEYLANNTKQSGGVTINRFTKRPVRALCVMHTLGHPVDLDALAELAEKYHLILLEDAAEALGSYYKGVHVGHKGSLGALSFNGNKIITTGGGGAVLTNDPKLARQAKHLTTTAKCSQRPWEFAHDAIGYNYRLPNINAALGCAQLEKMPANLRAKRQLTEKYAQTFANFPGMKLLHEPAYAKSNYWLNALVLDAHADAAATRDTMLATLNQNGFQIRPLWNLMHTLPMYADAPRMPLPVAESLFDRILQIPSSPQLLKQTQSLIAGIA